MDAAPLKLMVLPTILLVILFCNIDNVVGQEVKTFPLLMPNVQPKEKDSYLCTSFKMSRHDHEYIVEFHPNATMQTAHHILIYGCEIPGKWERDTPRLVWDCGEMVHENSHSIYKPGPTCAKGSQIIYAWAMEAPALKLPEGVAFKVGKGTPINYLVLQVHYAHVDRFINGDTDNSGILLTMLPSNTISVTKTAGVYLLGTGGYIPAKQTEHMETACAMTENLELHPFAFRTHAHALGRINSGYVISQDGRWTLIGKHSPQEPQMFYPVENKNLVIKQGDILAARCTMVSFRNRTTYIGSTGEDEMCNFYVMYYVNGEHPLEEKYCFSAGPPIYYWSTDTMLGPVPQYIDESASKLQN